MLAKYFCNQEYLFSIDVNVDVYLEFIILQSWLLFELSIRLR